MDQISPPKEVKKRGRPKGSKNKPKEGGCGANEGAAPVSNIHLAAAAKAEPARKTAKSNAAQSYKTYTPLAKTSLGNTELYNLYGIVIDASSPHPKKNFFRQLLKIVDPSMHYK
mmetsp:Transcript_39538/g.51785  ORF Transcript_39538/g.51785 Transcript_39538/m.51785 type:complete len:114 (+) Transcript_39538:56-397(+)